MEPDVKKPGLIASTIIDIIGLLMFAASYGFPDWVSRTESPARFGIWIACLYNDSFSNCSLIETSELKATWDKAGNHEYMNFISTIRAFSSMCLIFLLIATASYIACFVRYKDWQIAVACGLQLFSGLMTFTACWEWISEYDKLGTSLLWGFYLAMASGIILALNGIIYIVFICSGVCYIRPYKGGFILRGDAYFEHQRQKREGKA